MLLLGYILILGNYILQNNIKIFFNDYIIFFFLRYCQGTGTIAASLLLLLEEEDAFWMMATIVEDLLPASYYSSTLLGNK